MHTRNGTRKFENQRAKSHGWACILHSVIDQVETRPVLAFGRQPYDLDEDKPIGIVLFEAEPSSVLSALHNLRLGANSQVYLMGHENRIVSATFSDRLRFCEIWNSRYRKDDVIVHRRIERVIIASKLPFADWSAISVTPGEDLNVSWYKIKGICLLWHLYSLLCLH